MQTVGLSQTVACIPHLWVFDPASIKNEPPQLLCDTAHVSHPLLFIQLGLVHFHDLQAVDPETG